METSLTQAVTATKHNRRHTASQGVNLDTSEAARQLGVTPRQVRRLLESQQLTGVQFGEPGRNGARGSLVWDINPQSVRAYIAQRERAKQARRARWLANRRPLGKPIVFGQFFVEPPEEDI